MTIPREQQQKWLRENWGEMDYEKYRRAHGDNPECVTCGAEPPLEQLFEVGGLIICSANCGVEALEESHPDLDDWAAQAEEHAIYENLGLMTDGCWPPRKPLDELRTAVQRNLEESERALKAQDVIMSFRYAEAQKSSYERVLQMIDRLLAGESLEEKV